MGNNIWSCDFNTDTIYQHSGFTTTILDSFSSPGSQPTGLAIDGTPDLYVCDYTTDTIYQMVGLTGSVNDSFASPSSKPIGLTHDGTNLYSCDENTDLIYKHDGFSSTILTSISAPLNQPYGLSWDGTDLYSCDGSSFTKKVYHHSGFSTSILGQFTKSTYPTGLTYDGTNLYSCSWGDDMIEKHDGFSATVLDSISTPSTFPAGLAWGNFDARVGNVVIIPRQFSNIFNGGFNDN